jgi:2,5-furandicarboxylate decarboxylase 1
VALSGAVSPGRAQPAGPDLKGDSGVAFRDLRETVAALEAAGRLIEVSEELCPRHEMGAFLALASRQRPPAAYRFTNVSGHRTPVVANVVHDRAVFAAAMGVATEEAADRFAERLLQPVEPVPVDPAQAPVLEEQADPVDLSSLLPLLTHYEKDSGPYLTSAMTSVRVPEDGRTERTLCRLEYRGRDRLGVGFLNPPLGDLWRRPLAEPLRLAVVVGLEPVTQSAAALPPVPGLDKLAVAGGVRRAAVEVCEAPLTRLLVPARAEYLFEGTLEIPGQKDGPMGESSGYYQSHVEMPTLRVERVSHRREPLYQALLPTGPEVDVLAGLTVEASIAPHLRVTYPFVRRLYFVPSTFGTSLVVQVARAPHTRVRGLLHHLTSVDRVKKVIIVAEDVDPADPQRVEWSLITRCQPHRDVIVFEGLRGHPIDPTCLPEQVTSRLGIDATGYDLPQAEGPVGYSHEALERAADVLAGLQ